MKNVKTIAICLLVALSILLAFNINGKQNKIDTQRQHISAQERDLNRVEYIAADCKLQLKNTWKVFLDRNDTISNMFDNLSVFLFSDTDALLEPIEESNDEISAQAEESSKCLGMTPEGL